MTWTWLNMHNLTHKVLKSVIKHFIFSVYFNKYAFLHLILLITFDRVHISQKARCYVHQLIESFPVIDNMSRNTKKNLDSDIVDTYLHASRVFSTFLPYRPIFLLRVLWVTSPLSLRRDSFITPDIKDFFSSPNAELCLSPTKIDGFPHSGIL